MITPLDIRNHEFSSKMRGYDPDEVKAVLDNIAKDFEEISRQNTQLSERLKIAEERLNHYRLIEKTLQDAVITIQNTLEEKRKVAQMEAEAIIQDAKQRANEELLSSREKTGELRAEIHTLENLKMQFFMRFRNLLRSQAQILEAMMEAEEKESTRIPEAPGREPSPSVEGETRLTGRPRRPDHG